ncbi:CYTH-like domain-containing protein [Haematococcus lacustris]
MEVEVKIRLPDQAAHAKVLQLLAAGRTASYAQENYFFDGTQRELEGQRAVLRLRFYNQDEKATITIKGKQVLAEGIGRATEVEEQVADVQAARQWLTQPDAMLTASPLLQSMKDKLGLRSSLVCLGGFRNQREVVGWEGEVLELDQTSYEWGSLFEIECETVHPEAVRDKLHSFLAAHGVPFSHSQCSKFANFVNRTLL